MRWYLPQPDTRYHSRPFEDFEFYDTILPWEQHFDYLQPWEDHEQIKLQLISDMGPHSVNIIDEWEQIVRTVQYQQVFANRRNSSLRIFRLDVDLSGLSGVYRLQRISGIDEPLIVQSNKIHVCQTHPHTLVLDYRDEQYHEGTFFQDSSGTSIYYPTFRVEGGILFDKPASKGAPDFEDQPLNLRTVKAIPYNRYQMVIGNAGGVPHHVIDLINRIMTCSDVQADGRGIVKPIGSDFEKNEVNGRPTKGWTTEVRLKNNRPSRVYINNQPQNARIAVGITVGSKGFGLDTGGSTFEVENVE